MEMGTDLPFLTVTSSPSVVFLDPPITEFLQKSLDFFLSTATEGSRPRESSIVSFVMSASMFELPINVPS